MLARTKQIRTCQVYLFTERRLNARTVGHHTAALSFFFCKTLKRTHPIEEVPYPKAPRRLPTILTQDEAIRLIDCAFRRRRTAFRREAEQDSGPVPNSSRSAATLAF